MIFNLPVSYLFLRLGYSPQITMLVSISISLITIVVRAFILDKMVALRVSYYLREVVLPLLLVSLLSPILPYLLSGMISHAWANFFCVTLLSIVTLTLFTFYLAFSAKERASILSFVRRRKAQ